ncbi:MAG: M28 family peptidase [Longimicrobiales bacterium]
MITRGLQACIVLAFTLTATLAFGTQAHAQAPDSVRLMRTIGILAHDSMEGRATGTAGSIKAQKFLEAEFAKRGLKPFLAGKYSEAFKLRGSRTAPNDSVSARNIAGVIRGMKNTGKYIVVSAHYDHLGMRNGSVFNGADDNASGTAAILEVASWFADHEPAHNILIVAFDAEERGDAGSHAFLAMHKAFADSVLIDINLDMVGRNVGNELYAAGTTPYPFLLTYVQTAAARAGLKLLTGHDNKGGGQDDWTNQSDHGAFHALGIPYIYFGEEDHPDYHRATDEIAGIMPGFYVNAVRVVLDVVRQIDAKPFVRVK